MTSIYDVLDSLFEIVYISDCETHKILYINKSGKDVFGDCVGKDCREVIYGNRNDFCRENEANKDGFTTWQYENQLTGRTYNVREKIIDVNGKNVRLTVANDVTDSIKVREDYAARMEQRLWHMSYFDTLTNVYNRNKFIEDSKAEFAPMDTGVVYMDLNGLKTINDNQGHSAGDEALRSVSLILLDIFNGYNIYRMGGDEFVIICRGIGEEEFNARLETLRQRIQKSDFNSAIGARFERDCVNVDEAVKSADEKMYLDKKYFYRHMNESGRYRFRNDTFMAISTPELLKKLITDERFVIWFQPRFSVKTGELSGSEALVRFFDDDGVLVSPLDFIPEMEDNQTIHIVDFYVFKHACEYISAWLKAGKNVKPVSVNISHKTMMLPGFTETLMDIWFDYDVPKDLIIIEVTEDRERGGVSRVSDVLTDLKKRGFKIAIDNFGSKYADIYLFADLKFDILKLDGDMVYKMETDKKAWILSESISQICHSEHIKIVAEGVENDAQLEMLKKMGCDEAQGYKFDKPMPWNKFEEKYL